MKNTIDDGIGRTRCCGMAALVRGAILLILTVVGLSACGHLHHMFHGDVARPPAEAFGYGPRASDSGLYQARVVPAESVRINRMHSWTLVLTDTTGTRVTGADVTVDGGMPQHGHGLPTNPRVMAEVERGEYRVDGLRFNMSGWWEVRFRISAPGGSDNVTFNIDL